MRQRSVRLAVVATATAGVVLTGTQGVASARPWTADYPWQTAVGTGYDNWVTDERPPATGAPGPFYDVWRGGAPVAVGRGLAIRPTGGKPYDNGRTDAQEGGPGVIVRWTAPGASRITGATFGDLRYRNENDDQYFRLRVPGAIPGPEDTEDYGPDRGQSGPDQTYSPAQRAFTPNGGSSVAETWLFTICHPNPPGSGVYGCPTIPTTTGTFGRIGRVRLSLDDPDRPSVAVTTQPDIDDGWVSRRRAQKLTVTATDPSSGVARIRIRATNSPTATGGSAILDAPITCDRTHSTANRGGLNCPPSASGSKTDPVGSQSRTGRTYTVTAVDDAGNESEPVVRRIRYDSDAPKGGSLGGELARMTGTPTNRLGTVPVTVRATDARSGVARVELVAQRATGGRAIVLGAADTTCDGGCRTVSQRIDANLDALTRDGRYRLQVRATDRAGNTTKPLVNAPGLRPLVIDRTAPRKFGRDPFYADLGGGRIRVYVPLGRDNPGGAGLGNYLVRYTPLAAASAGAASAQRVFSTRADSARERRYKKQRFGTFTLNGVDTLSPVEAPVTACDDARFGIPVGELGDEVGNCPRVTELPALSKADFTVPSGVFATRGSAPTEDLHGGAILAAGGWDLLIDVLHGVQPLKWTAKVRTEIERRESSGVKIVAHETERRLHPNRILGVLRSNDQSVAKYDCEPSTKTRQYRTVVDVDINGVQDGNQVFVSRWFNVPCPIARRTGDDAYLCKYPGALYEVPFTKHNTRWNLCVFTQSYPSRSEAHHVLPQQFEKDFSAAGVGNIHHPTALCWLTVAQHQTSHRTYNGAWDDFLTRQAKSHSDGKLHDTDRGAIFGAARRLSKRHFPACKIPAEFQP